MSVAAANISGSGSWSDLLQQSHEHCREVSRSRAANFYHGMKLVPEPKRSANYALYAWMRQADDLADEAGEFTEKEQALQAFRQDSVKAIAPDLNPADLPPGPIWPAFRDLVLTYQLPIDYLHAMIDGQLLDQHQMRYHTFDQLYDYCYKVASVVGLSCIEVWGYDGGAETRKLSEYRGIAFQLTNILRDVLEDAERDRVYLPAEDFGVYELKPVMFTMDRSGDVERGLARVAERARDYYEKSAPLDQHVHPDGRACLWAMTQIYRGLLDQILRDPGIVLRRRVRLSGLRKATIAMRASLRRRARA